MKLLNYIKLISICGFSVLLNIGCDDFLDQEPLSTVSPEKYLKTEGHLESYVNKYYSLLPTSANNTTNDNNQGTHERYLKNALTVSQADGDWYFGNIYAINYFLEHALQNYEDGIITGDPANIEHYLGEGYFLRAYEYFTRLRLLGDFPIITNTLPDKLEALVEASKRCPRNEVARFILEDLDKAIELMDNNRAKTRITRNAALLFKSRVALYEATWEKYHAGTARVPKGQGWPGADKDYNKDYQFPSGSLEGEINFFLDEAMEASKSIAEALSLTENSKTIRDEVSKPENPYYNMFASKNPSGYEEVILYCSFNYDLGISHWTNHYMYSGGHTGYCAQFEHAFLMDNGLPWYAPGSGYRGDDYIADTKIDRDWRWRLFMKAPGEVKTVDNIAVPEYFPIVPRLYIYDDKNSTTTGYIPGKRYSLDNNMRGNGTDETAYVVFRAAEAYLNYIEASYLKEGKINAFAAKYWRELRKRAGVDADFEKTITATDMSKEAENDWGAYSGGKLLTDATLYNIRRERRCEFIGEGFRLDDLKRWRALEQLNGYQQKGAKIFGPMQSLFVDEQGNSLFLFDQPDQSKNNVSSPKESEYLLPNHKTTASLYFDGFYFPKAHYLSPIAVKNFLNTAPDGVTIEQSPIYQNPGWGTVAGTPAQE